MSSEFGRDVGEVLMTTGVSGGLLLAMLAMIDPGDEVVFLDPYFVMYKHLVTMAGGKPVHGGQLSRFPFSRRARRAGNHAEDKDPYPQFAEQPHRRW